MREDSVSESYTELFLLEYFLQLTLGLLLWQLAVVFMPLMILEMFFLLVLLLPLLLLRPDLTLSYFQLLEGGESARWSSLQRMVDLCWVFCMPCSYFSRVAILIWLFFYFYWAKIRSLPNFYILAISCYNFYQFAFGDGFWLAWRSLNSLNYCYREWVFSYEICNFYKAYCLLFSESAITLFNFSIITSLLMFSFCSSSIFACKTALPPQVLPLFFNLAFKASSSYLRYAFSFSISDCVRQFLSEAPSCAILLMVSLNLSGEASVKGLMEMGNCIFSKSMLQFRMRKRLAACSGGMTVLALPFFIVLIVISRYDSISMKRLSLVLSSAVRSMVAKTLYFFLFFAFSVNSSIAGLEYAACHRSPVNLSYSQSSSCSGVATARKRQVA